MATELADGLGGEAGFGENALVRTDDGSSTFIDLAPALPAGLNFYGFVFTGLWVNNNGSVSFGSAMSTFTPTAITGSTANPLITPFWADVDTRGGAAAPTPGGTSSGSNRVWYDLDTIDGVFTVTWDDVGYFNRKTDKANAFQLRLHQVGNAGDFDIEFRYETMNWTTGDFSGGSGGLGGTVARAGYSSGNGLDFLELPQSGNQNAVLGLPSASNAGEPGTFVFAIRNGAVQARVSVGDARVEEGSGGSPTYVVVPVTLSAPADGPVQVRYLTQNGSAVAGQDYVAQRGTVVFAPGTSTQEIRIEVTGDRRVELDETFTLRLFAATGAEIADARGSVTIANDDGLAVADVTAIEGTAGAPGSMVFTVRLLSAMDTAVTLDWATADGTAIAGQDYVAGAGSLTFAPGETTKSVTVSLVGDAASESTEALSLTLSNAVGAPLVRATATGNIADDDVILIDDVTIVEGTASTPGSATITIRLAGPTDQTITVDYATEDGTAEAGVDYSATSGTATIASGQSSATFTVPILRDGDVEGSEGFTIRLTNASGAVIGDDAALVGVIDDDGFTITDVSMVEGTGGSVNMTFTVTLASALSNSASVDYGTSDGSAIAGVDYTATSGTLTFSAGLTSRTFTVPIATDSDFEGTEGFTVTLSNATGGSGIRQGTATGAIRDDDGIAIGDITVAEGTGGTTTATVTVTLTSTASPVTLDWATADGTAVAGQDYTAATGTLTFDPGETSKTIEITIAPDALWEANEAFRIVLSNAQGAPLVDASGSVTITNDDARDAPVVSVLAARHTEGNGGEAVMRFTLGLSYAMGNDVTVDYATADGSAMAGLDYTAASGTLTILAGQLSAVIDVPILDDTLIEGTEGFALQLSNPTGGATIGTAQATGSIIDDDARFDIATADALLAEGNSGTTAHTFTVTRSGDTATAHTVRWAVASDGAPGAFANADDFAGGIFASGRLVFAAGQTTRTITVQVAGDTEAEKREGFAVRLFDASAGATIGTARAEAAIGNDDAYAGGSGGDSLRGGPDGEVLDGSGGDDSLFGSAGADTILGGQGDDLVEGGAGADSLAGGTGDADLLSYGGSTGGVTVDLLTGSASGGDAAGDSLSGFEAVRGGTGADRLTGNDGDNTLYGGGGSGVDTLYGGQGDDRLVGGIAPGQAGAPDGVNIMLGGTGDDTFHVGPSADQVVELANGGIDTIIALRSFTLAAHVEELVLIGDGAMDGTGNEIDNALRGGGGDNLLRGLDGDDNLTGGAGNDTLVGGAGADVVSAGEGADLIRYLDLADSPRTARDNIYGFASGEDRLDLAAIGTAMGGWGTERFALGDIFTAARQVAWDAPGRTLRIEADGDLATVELAIVFSAGTSIVESDILFT
ncbi:Calx-beta domain-containing protein [Roseomonas sp. CECT 9278]|uniref:Calx-beta domain-containing protein n=1 Tax=Roseomonas sp. CECT 9278 TaxID=2845823 RepID=UPI001E3085C7|nr:Calx-beta domain-containing protein [Roseomonas sp. CECT 9278]